LESKLGIQIEEFNSPNHVRKDGYLVKKKDLSLFNEED
jgi:hypothetical protein